MRKSKSKYYHIRVSSPQKAVTCRTHDIGRKGHTKRIACRTASGKWYTQAFLIKKSDWNVGDPKLIRTMGRIMYAYPKAKLKAVGI